MSRAQFKAERITAQVELLERFIWGLSVSLDTKTLDNLKGATPINRVSLIMKLALNTSVDDYTNEKLTEVELQKKLGTDGLKEMASHYGVNLIKIRSKLETDVQKLIDKYEEEL